ncbi:uncharacterized protein STEHIDRAFT_126579 [Stereum hirsutum FP-91666 SS1]|uniref:Uncharacterized protein n=1 Tax=Stereum hirsutum (strain FP-91666) TaxID=721885 RepID=R7RVP7_STEHR|nr:uncharacterized protein STEHIDRAFT_126579 [Stereum hirsutum FP-91666 SS1]EIM79216.1 hypothetical protein STEHIDRAFT_126579 [Stereum hirsutum FP-91666 SS1]
MVHAPVSVRPTPHESSYEDVPQSHADSSATRTLQPFACRYGHITTRTIHTLHDVLLIASSLHTFCKFRSAAIVGNCSLSLDKTCSYATL